MNELSHWDKEDTIQEEQRKQGAGSDPVPSISILIVRAEGNR